VLSVMRMNRLQNKLEILLADVSSEFGVRSSALVTNERQQGVQSSENVVQSNVIYTEENKILYRGS